MLASEYCSPGGLDGCPVLSSKALGVGRRETSRVADDDDVEPLELVRCLKTCCPSGGCHQDFVDAQRPGTGPGQLQRPSRVLRAGLGKVDTGCCDLGNDPPLALMCLRKRAQSYQTNGAESSKHGTPSCSFFGKLVQCRSPGRLRGNRCFYRKCFVGAGAPGPRFWSGSAGKLLTYQVFTRR